MLYELFILASYAFLGGGMKYADQAYDLQVFSRRKANLLAIPGAALMTYLVVFDPPSATIFFALLLVVALTKKIDNLAFYIGTGVLFIFPLIMLYFNSDNHSILQIGWLPFIILVLAGIADEVGNDWADKRLAKKANGARGVLDDTPLKKLGEKFFRHRFAMKLGVFALAAAAIIPPLYFLAFLLFDIAYLLVDWYSLKIKNYNITRPIIVPEAQ
jgi:hypothetical protein